MKKHQFIILLCWPIIAAILSTLFNAGLYSSLFLFFVVPCLYLSYYNPKLIKKALVFSLACSISMAFLFDYVMELTGAWRLGRMEFPQVWFLQYVSLIQIFWLFFYIYLIVIYYETFFDRSVRKIIYPRTKWLFLLMLSILAFVVFGHFFFPDLLYINYFYLKAGIVLILLPLLAFLFKFPTVYRKFFKVGLFFFYFNFIYEITALGLKQWSFPAENQFIGQVTFYSLSFPVEELFFWIIIGSVACLSYYEFFEDDGK